MSQDQKKMTKKKSKKKSLRVGKYVFPTQELGLEFIEKDSLEKIEYKTFGIQQYIISIKFSVKQIRLLFSLRSKSYPAKTNFSKMHRGNLRCRLGCL